MTTNNDKVIVLGDYNLPHLNWISESDFGGLIPCNVSSESESLITEAASGLGLHQMNHIANRNNRILDLAFVSDPNYVELIDCALPLLKPDHYHTPFVILLDVSTETSGMTADEYYFDFPLCETIPITDALNNVDWTNRFDGRSVDDATDTFYNILFDIIRELVPVKKRKHKITSCQPWWNGDLRNCHNRLRKARKRFFRHRSDDNKTKLRELETHFNSLNDVYFRAYTARLELNLKNDPQSFWSFIKQRKQPNGLPASVFYKDNQASTATDTANLFSSFFQSLLSNILPPLSEPYLNGLQVYNVDLPCLTFSHQDILSKLQNIDTTKGAGPDLLPPSFIQRFAASFSVPATILFNRSLAEGCFPTAWKSASIIPIHKSGNTHNVENYRGVSLLSCFPKIFERLLHDVVYSSLHSMISPYQHGFIRKRSTTTNLLDFVSTVIEHISKRLQIDAVYVDFSKAFDKVPHQLAIEKFKRMGLPGWLTKWLESYLTGRNAHVRIGETRSTPFNITSGVPQGSILGPLIFVLFVNDICDTLSSPKLLFADDLKFYRIIKSLPDCSALQEDINVLLTWCHLNGMEINIKKCCCITFTRKTKPLLFNYKITTQFLQKVTTVKDLGVYLDNKLTFAEHVSVTTSKAFVVLGFIRRNTQAFEDIYCLKSLYCSLVRSIVEYGALVWAPHFTVHIDRIERIQKSFIRYALRQLPWNQPMDATPYVQKCQLINLPTLSTRRALLQRIFIYDLLNNNIDCSDLLNRLRFNAPTRRLRHHDLFRSSFNRTIYGQNNPLWACCQKFNEVSHLYDFHMSKNLFKSRISS